MKNWFVLVFATFAIVSCSTTKPTASSANAGQKVSSSPEFINSISVIPGKPVVTSIAKKSTSGINVSKDIIPLTNNSVAIEKVNSLVFKYAILLDMPVENISGESDLFEFIDDWYGTPYRYGGTTKSGIDCSGFTGTLLANVFGIKVPRIARDQYQSCQKVSRSDLQEGDLVFFNIRGRGVSHVGVYLMNNKFIHASVNRGVVISDLGEGYYSKKFVGGGRPRK